jgi:type II restriction enzyme
MSLTAAQRDAVARLLREQIERKLTLYFPETQNMPFHTRLVGRDRMALFSFVQSLNTTLGVSVFEQTAVICARPNFKRAVSQYKEFNNTISEAAQREVQAIIDYLRLAQHESDKEKETARLLAVANKGDIKTIHRPRIDFFVETHDGQEFYFDLKTAKPNIGESVGLKRMLLEWVAIRAANNPKAKIHTMLGIPYNPYAPEPYERYALKGLFDQTPPYKEIMVAEEFWDFLGGPKTYEDLLGVFEQVGNELRPKIDKRFAEFREMPTEKR